MPITIKNNPEDAGGVNNCIVITIPARGETGWADLVRAAFKKISQHDHTGNENGTQLGVASLEDGAVTKAKINANVAGEGLTKDATSGALNVKIDDVTIERDAPTNTLRLKDDGVSAAKLNADVAGLGLVQNGTDESLEVNVDDSTIEIDTDIVRVKDLGIITAKLADAAITTAKLFNGSVTTDKIADDAVTAAKIPFISDTVATDAVQNDTLVWNATSGQFEPQAGGGGGGAAGINHVEEPDAESTLATWSASLSSDFNVTAETSTILRGLKSFRLRKAAKVVASPYVEVSFSIPNADLAKKHLISFDYDADDANYADGDIRLSVIKDPSGTPVEIKINGEDLRAGKGTHYAQFQTDATETSYKLRFTYKNTTDANLVDVFLDTVKVSPVGVTSSSTSNDIVGSFTLSTDQNITSNLSKKIRFDTTLIDTTGSFVPSTAVDTLTDGYYEVPESGFYDIHVQTTFTNVGASDEIFVGVIRNTAFDFIAARRLSGLAANSQQGINISCVCELTKGDKIFVKVDSLTDNDYDIIIDSTANTFFQIAKRPSLSLPESVGSGRDIAARYTKDDTQTFNRNTETKIEYDDIDFDTTNSMITTGADKGTYIIPETGYYDINARVGFSQFDTDSDTLCAVGIYVDNALVSQNLYTFEGALSGSSRQPSFNISETLYLEKNQEVYIYFWYSATSPDATEVILSGVPARTNFSISKRQSAQTVLETETVAAKVTLTAPYTQSLPDNNFKTIQFNTTEFDTHGCLDLATNSLIAPVTGYYQVSGNILISQVTNTSQDANINWHILKTSSIGDTPELICWQSEINYYESSNTYIRDGASTTIYMEKGDSIKLQINDYTSDADSSIYINEYSFLTFARLK